MAGWSPESIDNHYLNDGEVIPTAPSYHAAPQPLARKRYSRSSSFTHNRVEDPGEDLGATAPSASSQLEDKSKRSSITTPTGYNIMRYFAKRNILYLIPNEAADGCPIAVSGTTVRGGGSFTDESKFEVLAPRGHPSERVVAFRNLKYPDRYLCIDRKGKIKARNGYKDSCDFFVSAVGDGTSPAVYFESAQTEGYFLGVYNSSVVNASTITAESSQAHFLTRLEDSSHSGALPKLRAFGKDSIMNKFPDRSVVRLFSLRRYLAIDKKGNVCQTHNQENGDCWFVLHDRGMGIVSLQSYKYPGVWIKLDEERGLSAKRMLGPDSFFTVKECKSQLVCFEANRHPGLFIVPPLGNPSLPTSPEFDMDIVRLSNYR